MPPVAPKRKPTPVVQHVAYRPFLILLALGPWVGWAIGWWYDAREARRRG